MRRGNSSRLLDVKLDLKQTKEPGNLPISGGPFRKSSASGTFQRPAPGASGTHPLQPGTQAPSEGTGTYLMGTDRVAIMMSLKHPSRYAVHRQGCSGHQLSRLTNLLLHTPIPGPSEGAKGSLGSLCSMHNSAGRPGLRKCRNKQGQ